MIMKRIAIRACAYKVDNLVSKEICRWPPIDKHQDMIELFIPGFCREGVQHKRKITF